MTLSDIQQLVSLKLGEQNIFYTPEEITRSAINPAQRLMCLVHPDLIRQRVTVTVGVDLPIIDLRTLTDSAGVLIGNRIRRVDRVMLGDVSGATPVRNAVTGELQELRPTTVKTLSNYTNGWMAERGLVRNYWCWGPYWIGLYKRPITATTITVIFDVVPAQLVSDGDTPQTQDVYHRVIAEIAAGLAVIKEGVPTGERGLAHVAQALKIPQTQHVMQQQGVA